MPGSGSSNTLRGRLVRLVDLRMGEGPTLARVTGSLFLIVAAHAVLETVRDALLLSRFPARNLAAVYPAVALGVIPFAAVAARWSARAGARAALVAALVMVAATQAALFIAPPCTASILATYVLSGLFGGVLIPLYWSLLARVWTATQARRLVSVVAAAGTMGAVAGSGAAFVALKMIPLRFLLLQSATLVLLAISVLPRPSAEGARAIVAAPVGGSRDGSPLADPFVRRVALLIGASTAAFVVLDFFFKWTVARSIAPEHVAPFVARFGLLTSVAALLAQLVASRALLRRLGVAWTMLITPLLIVASAAAAAALGGMMAAVLVLKALDETLRNSVYRTTLELAYLPLPPTTRDRAKPLIDGGMARGVQTIIGGVLLAGGVAGSLSAPKLAIATLGLAGLWLVSALALQKPYMGLLRRAIGSPELTDRGRPDALDLASAEALIAYLAHEDEFLAVGAMNALARRGRSGLISALILLRQEESVLARALTIFAASNRKDWIAGARRLLSDPRDAVSMSAARALAAHGSLNASDLAQDERPRLRGYSALFVAIEQLADADPTAALGPIVGQGGKEGMQLRAGVLSALADAPPTPALGHLLETLASRADAATLSTAELARAAAQQHAVSLIPTLISRLEHRDGRDAVRAALRSFGADAIEPLARALRDPARARSLRIHVPSTLSRFGTKRAVQVLLETIEGDANGLVRYKSIRALGRLIAESRIKINARRVERVAERDLVEHFRLLGLIAPFDARPYSPSTGGIPRSPTQEILVGMLNDKLRQSLERVFRLLKIIHPEEDLHRVHAAFLSEDKRARAHAVELVTALVPARPQSSLRDLLRIVGEEPSLDEAVERSRPWVPTSPPSTLKEALDRLARDTDRTLAGLARLDISARTGIDVTSEHAAVDSALRTRGVSHA